MRRTQVLELGTLTRAHYMVPPVCACGSDVSPLPKAFQLNALAFARLEFRIGVASLERDAMSLDMAGIRLRLGGGAVKYLLIRCAQLSAP